MKMLDSKKGFNVAGMVTGLILLIVGIIIVFNVLSSTASDLTTSAGNVSASGLPLASLFGSTGPILLVFMAGVMIALILGVMKLMKK